MIRFNANAEDNASAPTEPLVSLKSTSELRLFDFKGEAIDTALRKLLAKMLLPKEAQQIDRAMEDFAKRYHMCNPSLADGFASIYAVAFSLLLLHTDAHNKNVKRKMDKDTFIMRTKEIEGGGSVYSEILDIMYDNIVYSEFTYAYEQPDKSYSWFSKKTALSTGPLLHDFYPKLEQLMPTANIFKYKSAPNSAINMINIHQSIEQAQPLSLSGVRYRQEESDVNRTSLVWVCKYGVIERKSDLSLGGKRSSARGWRPFGMALSGSQIIFFGDIIQFQSWAESQQPHEQPINNESSILRPSFLSSCLEQPTRPQSPESSISSLKTDAPTTLRSNLSYLSIIPSSMVSLTSTIPTTSPSQSYSTTSHLRPIQILSLSDAVCVYDESYQKHPHVFRLAMDDGQQFLIRGNSNEDINDWIQKINYVSAMKSTGVRLRPKTLTIKPEALDHNMNVRGMTLNKGYNQLGIQHYHRYHHLDGHPSQHWAKQEAKAQAIVVSLSQKLDEHKRHLTKDEQLRNQLMVLIPGQKATKDRMLTFAETIGKRLMHQTIVLRRLECYQELIEQELFFYQSFKNRERFKYDNGSRHSGNNNKNNHNHNNDNAMTRGGKPTVIRKLSDSYLYLCGSPKERSVTTSTNQSRSSSSLEIRMAYKEDGKKDSLFPSWQGTNNDDGQDNNNKEFKGFLCIYCTLLLIALFSSTCYWGQGRCWIDLQQARLFDVRPDSNATFGQGEGWWNYKLTLPIGTT